MPVLPSVTVSEALNFLETEAGAVGDVSGGRGERLPQQAVQEPDLTDLAGRRAVVDRPPEHARP